jgi:hypothetical protein
MIYNFTFLCCGDDLVREKPAHRLVLNIQPLNELCFGKSSASSSSISTANRYRGFHTRHVHTISAYECVTCSGLLQSPKLYRPSLGGFRLQRASSD